MDEFYGGNVYSYSVEPTSSKGLHRYIDFYSMLPDHIKNRPDLMKIVYLFQDYLNDGYRKIPEPTVTHSYKNLENGDCSSVNKLVSYTEVRRPFNHDPSMYKRSLTGGYDYVAFGDAPFEEYDKERDISTWAIDFDVMDAYKAAHSSVMLGLTSSRYSYYNEPKQYFSPVVFYSQLSSIVKLYGNDALANIFMYFSEGVRDPRYSLDEAAMSLSEIMAKIPKHITSLPPIEFTYYACDASEFLDTFSSFNNLPNVMFRVESRKIPYFVGISDSKSYIEAPQFSHTDYRTFEDLSIDASYTGSFRVSFKYEGRSSSDAIIAMLSTIKSTYGGEFAFKVFPDTMVDVANFVSIDTNLVASALTVIHEYEHPEVFYEAFGGENQYRHVGKGASIAEKIYRMAYSKDADVFDYDYLKVIAHHFGYSIETDEDEINHNSYYRTKEDKEMALRKIISNMPEYNRMKGTDSGIEMVILSFGLVGRIVTLFTRGNGKKDGYAEFIDSRLVSGDIDEYAEAHDIELNSSYSEVATSIEMSKQFNTHAKISDTSMYDWYSSPHFRIEFDVLKDFLNISRDSSMFSTIAKTVKRIKPINTVFQGFYAKLSEEYGHLFINPPLGRMRIKQIMNTQSTCEFVDEWDSQCAMEMANAG